MEAFCKVEERRHGSIGDEFDDDDLGCPSSSSSSSSSLDSSNSRASSSSSDFMDDATSSSSNSPISSSSSQDHLGSPLFEMSTLMEDLPIKRGLSRHYQGKSQSFASLANAKCLEDLAKPVRTCSKKRSMKPCKSYGGGLDAHKPPSPRGIAKKPSKGSLYSLVGLRRNGFAAGRPPIHPHSSGNLSSQAFLFA